LDLQEGGAWYKNDALVVMEDEGDQRTLLEDYYNVPTAGHPRVAKMVRVLTRDYWWPSV
jgi:hypothetical protein